MRGSQPSPKTGASHDRRGHQPVAAAHDRRHDDPQVRAEDPTRLVVIASSRPATAGCVQISASRRKSSDNSWSSIPTAAHSAAASPSYDSLHRLDPNQTARPRHSNPHSACPHGLTFPQGRFPPLEAFGRRPRRARHHLHGPVSETLHTSGRRSGLLIAGINCNRPCCIPRDEAGSRALPSLPAQRNASPWGCNQHQQRHSGRGHRAGLTAFHRDRYPNSTTRKLAHPTALACSSLGDLDHTEADPDRR